MCLYAHVAFDNLESTTGNQTTTQASLKSTMFIQHTYTYIWNAILAILWSKMYMEIMLGLKNHPVIISKNSWMFWALNKSSTKGVTKQKTKEILIEMWNFISLISQNNSNLIQFWTIKYWVNAYYIWKFFWKERNSWNFAKNFKFLQSW